MLSKVLTRALSAVWGAGTGRGALGEAYSVPPVLAEDHGSSVAPVPLGLRHREYADGIAPGEWPEDPYATPAWMEAVIDWHLDLGLKLPRYRCRHEFDEQLQRCRELAEAQPLKKALSPEVSAERFLGFLREEMGSDGNLVLASSELTDFYHDFCADDRRHPSPENFLRAALKRLPGVECRQVRVPDAPGRKRTFAWVITRDPETVSFNPVATIEPLRAAA
jgi:hypothetical protein